MTDQERKQLNADIAAANALLEQAIYKAVHA